MAEVKNKLKRLEDKKYVKDTLSLSGTWTAPHDGIVTCSGRATAAGAYLFCKDLTENEKKVTDKALAYKDEFEAAMDSDFNTADAVTAIFNLVKLSNSEIDEGSSAKLI